jgi:hypothetical protein
LSAKNPLEKTKRSSAGRAKLQGAQERMAKKTCRIKTMRAKAKLFSTKFVNKSSLQKIETPFKLLDTNVLRVL